MDTSEVGRLLQHIAELGRLPRDARDIGSWLGDMRDVTYAEAIDGVDHLVTVTSLPVSPEVLHDAVTRAREHQMGPGRANGVRPPERAELVPTPPWVREAMKASQRAAERCSEQGLSPGHPVTVRSCRAASLEVQAAWERANGRWDDVWRHWHDTTASPDDPPVPMSEPVTSL